MRIALSACLLVLTGAASAEANYGRVVYYHPAYVYDPCAYYVSYGSWYYSPPVFESHGASPSIVGLT